MVFFGKRGSHVEMMISFSIFILFIMTIFIIIAPSLKGKSDKTAVINSLSQKLIENSSSNITATLVKVEAGYTPPLGESCITISGGGWASGESVVAREITGERTASSFSYPHISIAWTGNRFFKIFSSNESFEAVTLDSSTCSSPLEGSNFNVKSIKTERYVFESGIKNLKTSYDSSYEDLKAYLNFPPEQDFGFVFINSNGVISVNADKNTTSKEVYSVEKPIIYVDNESVISSGILRLKVW